MYSYYGQQEEQEQEAQDREDYEADRADSLIKELKIEGYWPHARKFGVRSAAAKMHDDMFSKGK